MDALEIAYGEEWLTNYLEEHLEDLRTLQCHSLNAVSLYLYLYSVTNLEQIHVTQI